MRESCLRCFRDLTSCYCESIRPFECGVTFAILLHPRERRKRIGTGRMTHLCLPASRLIEGVSFDNQASVGELLADPALAPFLLFPGPGSIDLDANPGALAAAVPAGRRPLVFVVDGTWSCARKMIRLNPRLASLSRLSFRPSQLSRYGFRRQPHPDCYSTIEAVHHVIGAFQAAGLARVEPLGAEAGLIAVFERMVSRQAARSRLPSAAS